MKQSPEARLAQELKWVPVLTRKGWAHKGGMDFEKDGKVYDLSAANMDMLDVIVERGLFVRENP